MDTLRGEGTMKKIAAALLIAGSIAAAPRPASAAIPVIDTQNIQQQLKTYLESIKVVTNTAQQIALQLQELKSLPGKLLEKYKAEFLASIQKAKEHAQPTGILSEEGMWQKVWDEKFPVINADSGLSHTSMSERNVEVTMQALQSLQNKKDIAAYHNLMKDLQDAQKRLQELIDLNRSPEGAKQAAQIANEIALEQANIDSIKLTIQAISSQNQIMEAQRKIVKEQNERALGEAMAKATTQTIERMHREAANINRPTIRESDPFKRNGLGMNW